MGRNRGTQGGCPWPRERQGAPESRPGSGWAERGMQRAGPGHPGLCTRIEGTGPSPAERERAFRQGGSMVGPEIPGRMSRSGEKDGKETSGEADPSDLTPFQNEHLYFLAYTTHLFIMPVVYCLPPPLGCRLRGAEGSVGFIHDVSQVPRRASDAGAR